jgi:hypothetical protein
MAAEDFLIIPLGRFGGYLRGISKALRWGMPIAYRFLTIYGNEHDISES